MRPADEEQCEAAVRLGLITRAQAAECQAVFDPARHEDFAVALVDRGLLTGGQAERLRQGLTTTQAAPLVPGYEILEEIGRGGMGIVYRARHQTLDRIDAVKVLPPHMAADEEYVQRFLREARAAARLAHPNIVRVFDAGPIRPTYYLSMEYVDGPTFEALIGREAPMPPERAARLLVPVARALAYAHRAGIIHRDVKPSNILLTRDEVPKLTDLGLAKSPESTTASGRVLGTVQYMAPEQARDFKSADARADIYALGCTLYHALVGETPFRGDSAYAVMRQHETAVPPLTERDNERLSGDVRRLVGRMLAKAPENRPQSAVDVAEALEALAGLAVPQSPSAAKARARAGTGVPQAAAAQPPRAGTRRFTQLIHGFETKRDLERVTRNNPDCPIGLSLTRKGATQGDHALLAQFPAASDREASAFHLLDFRHDWAKYMTFSLDIHNPQRAVVLLRLEIEDRDGVALNRTLEVTPGASTIGFEVAELAEEVDIRDLKRVTFALAQDTPAQLSFDNLRLAGEAEAGGPVNAEPDLIVVGPQPEADYDDFAPAYMAAQTGDIIEIRSDDTYQIDEPLILGWHPDGRHIDRDVHIRAGKGFVPTLAPEAEHYTVSRPRLAVEGSATIEGLRLVARSNETEHYAYVLSGSRGSCRFTRCLLSRARFQWGREPSVAEGPVEIQECYLQGCLSKVIDFRCPIRVTDSVFWECPNCVQVQMHRRDQVPDTRHDGWDIASARCTFHQDGPPLVATLKTRVQPAGFVGSLALSFRQCAFSDLGVGLLAAYGWTEPAPPRVVLESDNRWHNLPALVAVTRAPVGPLEYADAPPSPPTLEVADMGFTAPERGDLRLKPDSVLRSATAPPEIFPKKESFTVGAPNHVAYPDFLYDLARHARETGSPDSLREADSRQE